MVSDYSRGLTDDKSVCLQPPPVGEQSEYIFCQKCGEKNRENNLKCTRCASLLHAAPALHVAVPADGTMGGLIPYKNPQALAAYYMGVFSIFPGIGFFLSIAALILGIRGLKYANKFPEARGKAHAHVGIVMGAICFIGSILLVGLMFFA